MKPATMPISGAGHSSMYPDGAVMATRPAIAPLPTMPMSIVPMRSLDMISAPSTPPRHPGS